MDAILLTMHLPYVIWRCHIGVHLGKSGIGKKGDTGGTAPPSERRKGNEMKTFLSN